MQELPYWNPFWHSRSNCSACCSRQWSAFSNLSYPKPILTYWWYNLP